VWCANQIVSEADLVIFVGSHTGDQVTNGWTVPYPGTPVVQLDQEPMELGRSYPNAALMCGDAKAGLRLLAEALQGKAPKEAWAETARQRVANWQEEVEPQRSSDHSPIQVERLCREISEFLPENGVLVADTGWSGIWTGTMVELKRPGQKYLRAAGSLGWSFPAALGAKCGAPERTVVCFTGDGAFYYHLGELETALRCGINTITVINNNGCFGQCEDGVKAAYGGRPGNSSEIYCFEPVDFTAVAQDMGCLGIKVEDAKDIAPALARAQMANRPAVVEVMTDRACQAPAPWTPSTVSA